MKVGNKGKLKDNNAAANRAEDVRRRRTQRSQQRVNEAKQRVAHPVRVRPVVVRGSAFGTPIHRQTSKQAPRRAFYVTMDHTSGTELRLPSLPMLWPGWRLLSALIAMAAMFGIYSMTNSTFFRLETIQINGLQRISPEEVSDTIDLSGVSIVEVTPQEVASKLSETYPELIDVTVDVALPSFVTINASERQPVVIWQKGDQIQWIDEEGVIFPPRGDAGPLVRIHSDDDLPMNIVLVDPETVEEDQTGEKAIPVTGPRTVEASLLTAAQGLYEKLPPDTAILYNNRDGLGWTDPQGWQVFIGNDLEDFEAKFSVYQKLVEHFNMQGIQPVLVSVEHLDAPFYRLEP